MNLNDEPADELSLEDALGAALDEGAAPIEEEASQETDAERLYRREGRRFVPKEEEKAATEAEAEAGAGPEKPAAKQWRPTWYKDEYGPWDKLSENFRNALRDQERNASQAIEKHSTAAKAWEPILKEYEPYQSYLQQMGLSPQQHMGQLLEAQKYLMQDPVGGINWLVQSYFGQNGITDIYALANALYEQQYQPPQYDPVQAQLAQLQNELAQMRAAPQQQAQAQVHQQITDWAKDKPDFAAVRPYMAAIAKQKPDASLDELYAEAQWAHPETRERILQQREDKRLAELKGKRQIGAASPRGAPSNGSRSSKPTMSLEEEIAMHLDGGV